MLIKEEYKAMSINKTQHKVTLIVIDMAFVI